MIHSVGGCLVGVGFAGITAVVKVGGAIAAGGAAVVTLLRSTEGQPAERRPGPPSRPASRRTTQRDLARFVGPELSDVNELPGQPSKRWPQSPLQQAPRSREREVINADALEWLRSKGPAGLPQGCSVVTSLPDWSEIKKGKDLSLRAYVDWFREAATLVFRACPRGTPVVFWQTDIQSGGQWVDKSALLNQAARDCGCILLWHKVAFDTSQVEAAHTGNSADYSHVLCFAAGPLAVDRLGTDVDKNSGLSAMSTKCDLPDLMDRGPKFYAQGMGSKAILGVVHWLAKLRPPISTIVDPFCGRGTVLALANHCGLGAVGVDLSAKCVKASESLEAETLLGARAQEWTAQALGRQLRRGLTAPDSRSRPYSQELSGPSLPTQAVRSGFRIGAASHWT